MGLNYINDAVGESIFHNRYSYANSNPVNLTDPSGLCSERDTQCHQDANYLTLFGFFPLWDENPLDRIPENLCSQATQVLNLSSTGKLKWTTEEMRSLRKTVNVLYRANQQIGSFNSAYQFPTNPVSLVKVSSLTEVMPPTSTPPPNTTPVPQELPIPIAGKTFYGSRIIQLAEDVWSNINEQQRSWIFIHEFGHILVQDIGYSDFRQGELATELDETFNSVWVSRYSYSGGIVEFLIEAITGTIWNAGYTAVSEYDSSAGGRTGFATFEEHINNPVGQFVRPRDVDPNQIPQFIANVRLIGTESLTDENTSADTVEKWILRRIFQSQ